MQTHGFASRNHLRLQLLHRPRTDANARSVAPSRSGVRALVAGLLVTLCSVALGAQSGVVINEINLGNPDYMELRNAGSSCANISGWTLHSAWGDASGWIAEPTVTMPAGTILAPGQILVLEEGAFAGAPGTTPNSIQTGSAWGFIASDSVYAYLLDGGGNGVDYVFADNHGLGGTPMLPAGETWTGSLTGSGDEIERVSDVDSDDAADWLRPGVGSGGSVNAGQTPHAGSGTIGPFIASGCQGTTSLAVTGNPNLGGSVTSQLSGFTGGPFVSWGFGGTTTMPAPLTCPCEGLVGPAVTWIFSPNGSFTLSIPCWPNLVGASVKTQGLDALPSAPACGSPPVSLTDVHQVIIGS